MQIKIVSLSALTPHSINKSIYGDEVIDQELVVSIRESGVLTPITINPDNIIISGHRRVAAAREAGLLEIHCFVVTYSDQLEEKAAIIEFNKQRVKTISQKYREAEFIEAIERERARLRMEAGGNQYVSPTPKLAEASKGETREKVAEAIGMKRGTYEAGKKVYEAAKSGDEKAITLMEQIDAGEVSISRAALELTGKIKQATTIATLHTGDEESYTPKIYIESARLVMGCINTDPASNDMAQQTVNADNYFTVDDDGLSKEWTGNVWMNPPYTALVINKFITKLCAAYQSGSVAQAIVLTNNNTDTLWFHEIAGLSSAVCFTKGRINFLKRDGSKSSPTNGQCFIYLGSNGKEFENEFSKYGMILK